MNIVNTHLSAHTHTNRLSLVFISRDAEEVKQIMLLSLSLLAFALIRVHTEAGGEEEKINHSICLYRRAERKVY